MPHVEVKIVHPETRLTVPRGEPGELCTRGYRNAGQCSGLQAGGEGPRGSAR
jgi:acyl-CoA synthetase (AMP-forming)/AMP-acid ligase II